MKLRDLLQLWFDNHLQHFICETVTISCKCYCGWWARIEEDNTIFIPGYFPDHIGSHTYLDISSPEFFEQLEFYLVDRHKGVLPKEDI